MKIVESWDEFDKKMDRINRWSKSVKRNTLYDTDPLSGKNDYQVMKSGYGSSHGIADKYKHFIMKILDEGWGYTIFPGVPSVAGGIYTDITFYKWFQPDGYPDPDSGCETFDFTTHGKKHIKDEFPQLLSNLEEAKSRFEAEHFKCKFQIILNGVHQQEKQNEYIYKGFGVPKVYNGDNIWDRSWKAEVKFFLH